jgi:hypothetical protein
MKRRAAITSTETSRSLVSRYPSKKDWWLWGSVALCALVCLIVPFYLFTEPIHPLLKVGVILLCLAAFGFLVCILFRVHYVLTPTDLLIRYPAMNRRIPLKEIYEVFPTNSAISSPALSLDRLHIRYRSHRFGVLVSPLDKQVFIMDLLSRCHHLTQQGDKIFEVCDT